MSRRLPLLLPVAAATVLASLHAAHALRPASTLAPITRQIDALLKQRLRPEPLPLDLPNPFLLPGAPGRRDPAPPGEPVVAVAEPVAPNPHVEARPPTNAEVLAECAAQLRIGGLMRVSGQMQLVVNGVLRKTGDVLTVPWNNTKITLTIGAILPDQVILRYGENELTLRY